MHDEQLHKHAGHAATHEHDAGAHAHGDKQGGEHNVQFRAHGKLPDAGHGFENLHKKSASDTAYGQGEQHDKLGGLAEKLRHAKHPKAAAPRKHAHHAGHGQAHVEPMPGGGDVEAPQAEAAGAVLQQGDHGPEVAELQQMLKAAGYYHAQIGGNFGPQTKSALEKFQADHGIEPAGTADVHTIEVLHETAPAVAAPTTEGAPAAEPTEQGPPSVGGQAACDYGTSVLGAPYMALDPWRFGEVPWRGGSAVDIHDKTRGPYPAGTQLFDCSGFVHACWKHAGVTLGLYSSAVMCEDESVLHTIGAGELRAGDIIAWHGHVGLYYGNGQVIESTPNGGVKISDAQKFINHSGAKCKRVRGT